MEEQNELNFEQVPNQEPLHVQETSIPIEQANNLLLTSVKLIS
jgi:hypothetical protein